MWPQSQRTERLAGVRRNADVIRQGRSHRGRAPILTTIGSQHGRQALISELERYAVRRKNRAATSCALEHRGTTQEVFHDTERHRKPEVEITGVQYRRALSQPFFLRVEVNDIGRCEKLPQAMRRVVEDDSFKLEMKHKDAAPRRHPLQLLERAGNNGAAWADTGRN